MTTALVPTSHARLSASGAHKWMHCPGSIEAEAPFPDISSKYADEGSAAHLVASTCLEFGRDAASEIGLTYNAYPTFPITADMAEHVQTYLDFVRGLWAFCDRTWIESKAMVPELLAKLPEDVGGTSDAGGIDFAERVLHVTDLKFGRGVLVEVQGNEQFRIYALGKYGELSHEDKMRLAYVEMHVIQPRARHDDGPIRSERITLVELLNWAKNELSPAAYKALTANAPRAAGDWCKFCKAKSVCTTFRDKAFDAMPFVFEELPNAIPLMAAPVPFSSPERVAEIYFALDRLEEWASAFRSFVFNEVSSGRPIPGVGLKRKRTNRKWMDDGMVRQYLTALNVTPFLLQPDKIELRSPADIEKQLKAIKQPFPEHLVVKQEGELTLCPADDKDALTTLPQAASQFTTLELP